MIAREWARLAGKRPGKKTLRSILLHVAVDLAPRPALTENGFLTTLDAVRKDRLDEAAVEHFIAECVPHEKQPALHDDWVDFRESLDRISSRDDAAVLQWLGKRVNRHPAVKGSGRFQKENRRNMPTSRAKRHHSTADN